MPNDINYFQTEQVNNKTVALCTYCTVVCLCVCVCVCVRTETNRWLLVPVLLWAMRHPHDMDRHECAVAAGDVMFSRAGHPTPWDQPVHASLPLPSIPPTRLLGPSATAPERQSPLTFPCKVSFEL